MSEKVKKYLHDLKIEEGKIILDGFELKGVNKYTLNYEAPKSTTELVLKLRVNSNIRMGNQDKEKSKGCICTREEIAPEVSVQEQQDENILMQGKIQKPCKLWLKPADINRQ